MRVYLFLVSLAVFTGYINAGAINRSCPKIEEDCSLVCQGGYAMDQQGCPKCQCWQPCEHTACFPTHRCRAEKICNDRRECTKFIIQGQCFDASDVCALPYNRGEDCGGTEERTFYNATSRRCESFRFLGCEGNANNFLYLEDCQSACENQRSGSRCADPRKSGFPCKGSPPRNVKQNIRFNGLFAFSLSGSNRWYYDKDTDSCRHLAYMGCGGNGNNFESVTDCNGACVRDRGGEDTRSNNQGRLRDGRQPPGNENRPPVPRRRSGRRDHDVEDICDWHEVYNECWNTECGIEATCLEPDPVQDPDQACAQVCSPKCLCEEGYVRDTRGRCVLPEDCPVLSRQN